MADGNLTERQKIAQRLREAQEKAAEQEAAYNARLGQKLEEARDKVAKKREAIGKKREVILKTEDSIVELESQLLDLQVLEEQYAKELAEVNANTTDDIEVPSFN